MKYNYELIEQLNKLTEAEDRISNMTVQDLNIIEEACDFLIEDELEAIDGYNRAINTGKFSGETLEILKHIKEEEEEHIQEIKKIRAIELANFSK